MKKFLFMHRFILLLILTLVSVEGRAWWNDAWPSRKQLTVDASITGADIQGTVQDFPVLVRLHSGNFGFFLDLAENGKDLRFMQQDKTALKHDVEKIDSLVELGLVWSNYPWFVAVSVVVVTISRCITAMPMRQTVPIPKAFTMSIKC